MERITNSKYSELISSGFDYLPETLNYLKYTHFFTGVNPIFAGLHNFLNTDDGRSYRSCWHVLYANKITKQTTVIMPNLNPNYPTKLLPMLIIHELGHVLDEILGFEHVASPITEYAFSNREEAFAEAFTFYLCPGYSQFYEIENVIDKNTQNLFRKIIGGNYAI